MSHRSMGGPLTGILTGVFLSLAAVIADARPVILGLFDLTGQAETVVQGKVSDFHGENLTVQVQKAVKGHAEPGPLQLHVDPPRTYEESPLHVSAGDDVLVFLAPGSNPARPIWDAQGVVKTAAAEVDAAARAVERISEFQAAQGREAREAALAQILALDFAPAAGEALGIIYGGEDVSTRALVPPVLALACGGPASTRVRAVQALGRIGGRPEIPALIDLLADPNARVAEIAFDLLRRWTRRDVGFKGTDPVERRRRTADEWRQWWQVNKGSAVLPNVPRVSE